MASNHRSDKRITIPATIEAAKEQLGGLGELLTAKEWERAAIVYAFTHDCTGEHCKACGETTARKSAREFAKLGITGLKSDQTVRTYRKAWQAAVDDGKAKPVKPGDRPETPDMAWPPTDPRTGKFQDRIKTQLKNADPETRHEAFKEYLSSPGTVGERKAELIAEALQDDYVAERVAESIGSNPELTARYEKAKTRTLPTAKAVGRRESLNPDDWQNWTAAEQEEFDAKTVKSARHLLLANWLRSQGYVASGEAEMLLDIIRPPADMDSELQDLIAQEGRL